MKLFGRPVLWWNGSNVKPVTRDYRISICTTCMGRLHDLRRTLPKNIDDNADYPAVEFVVLDYNSQDGLMEWVRDHMIDHLDSGRLVYYRTTDPKHYHMSHSRNVAFALATGEIVNNVDADNWTGANFAARINELANQCPQKAIFTRGWQSIHGRLGFFKEEWEALGGYDESFVGYGFDDRDLLNRACVSGFTIMPFGSNFCQRISTPSQLKSALLQQTNLRQTARLNEATSAENIQQGMLRANVGRRWAVAKIVKNFTTEIYIELGCNIATAEGAYAPPV